MTVCHDDMIRFEGRNARRSAVGLVLESGRNVLLILAVAFGPGQLQLYSGSMVMNTLMFAPGRGERMKAVWQYEIQIQWATWLCYGRSRTLSEHVGPEPAHSLVQASELPVRLRTIRTTTSRMSHELHHTLMLMTR